jgi:hypothetical protein
MNTQKKKKSFHVQEMSQLWLIELLTFKVLLEQLLRYHY